MVPPLFLCRAVLRVYHKVGGDPFVVDSDSSWRVYFSLYQYKPRRVLSYRLRLFLFCLVLSQDCRHHHCHHHCCLQQQQPPWRVNSNSNCNSNSVSCFVCLFFSPPLHREYGKRYTVWQDDANDPSGYRLLKAVSERPLGEALDDIYNIANGLADEESTPEFLNSVAKFVRDFGRM